MGNGGLICTFVCAKKRKIQTSHVLSTWDLHERMLAVQKSVSSVVMPLHEGRLVS